MKKLFPITLLVLTAFCGCKEFNNIPDGERPKFNTGDVFYYTSQTSGHKDTLCVMHKNMRPEIDEDYKESNYDKYYERADYVFVNVSTKVKFFIHQDYCGLGSVKVMIGGETYTMNEEGQIDLKIDKRSLYDVYVLSQDDIDTLNMPKTVYYSLRYGIVKYENADFETFTADDKW